MINKRVMKISAKDSLVTKLIEVISDSILVYEKVSYINSVSTLEKTQTITMNKSGLITKTVEEEKNESVTTKNYYNKNGKIKRQVREFRKRGLVNEIRGLTNKEPRIQELFWEYKYDWRGRLKEVKVYQDENSARIEKYNRKGILIDSYVIIKNKKQRNKKYNYTQYKF